MPTYERDGNCCCAQDCNNLISLATASPQICNVINSTCDATCATGSWNQQLDFQYHLGGTWAWDVLPQFVTFGNGIPDPGHTDNCKYCEWVNNFGFTQQYFTGLQLQLTCLGAGENAGKWQLQISFYRRGVPARGNCDEANDLISGTITEIVTGIEVDDNGYLVGGPFTLTFPYITWSNTNNSSGDPSDFEGPECTIDIVFGPQDD